MAWLFNNKPNVVVNAMERHRMIRRTHSGIAVR